MDVVSGVGQLFLGQKAVHGLDIGLGTVLGCQAGGLDLDDAAHFPDFPGRGPAQAEVQGLVIRGAGEDVGAVALAHFEQAGADQHPDGLAHGGTSDPELGHEHRFGRDLGTRRKNAQGNFFLDLLDDQVATCARAHGAQSGSHQMIS